MKLYCIIHWKIFKSTQEENCVSLTCCSDIDFVFLGASKCELKKIYEIHWSRTWLLRCHIQLRAANLNGNSILNILQFMKRAHCCYPSSNRMTFTTVEIHNNDLEFREQKCVKENLRLIALFLLCISFRYRFTHSNAGDNATLIDWSVNSVSLWWLRSIAPLPNINAQHLLIICCCFNFECDRW